MGTYKKPKSRLHRDFVYLQHDTVLNSLSAFEAGTVDEIIQKATDASDRSLEGGIGKGPVKVSGGRKKQLQVQEELVLKRTHFSAFEAWYQRMRADEAIGEFDAWDRQVRDALEVGDTILFTADVVLSPLHMVFATYSSFVKSSSTPGSVFTLSASEAAEARKTAKMIEQWITGGGGQRSTAVYFKPFGIDQPRIVGRLDDQYVIGGLDNIQGRFSVIAQVDTLLDGDERVSAIRVLRDVPPTPLEVETAREALTEMIEAATGLGVQMNEQDITFSSPAVLIRPLAIYK
jgi:hypothetical protein